MTCCSCCLKVQCLWFTGIQQWDCTLQSIKYHFTLSHKHVRELKVAQKSVSVWMCEPSSAACVFWFVRSGRLQKYDGARWQSLTRFNTVRLRKISYYQTSHLARVIQHTDPHILLFSTTKCFMDYDSLRSPAGCESLAGKVTVWTFLFSKKVRD